MSICGFSASFLTSLEIDKAMCTVKERALELDIQNVRSNMPSYCLIDLFFITLPGTLNSSYRMASATHRTAPTLGEFNVLLYFQWCWWKVE